MSDFGLAEAAPSWDEWLADFKRDLMPTFEKYGVSMDAAIVAFSINQLKNRVTGDGDDAEDWKG